jgi:hypothetical protein
MMTQGPVALCLAEGILAFAAVLRPGYLDVTKRRMAWIVFYLNNTIL